MNAGCTPRTPGIDAGTPADAEIRLALNRNTLQERLDALQGGQPSGVREAFGEIARVAFPLVRRAVRKSPYASLGGAMLAGMLLMRWKPWRGLGGSFLVGLLVRQALAMPASSGSSALGWLWSMVRAGRKSS
jgi:hypothetical protein